MLITDVDNTLLSETDQPEISILVSYKYKNSFLLFKTEFFSQLYIFVC